MYDRVLQHLPWQQAHHDVFGAPRRAVGVAGAGMSGSKKNHPLIRTVRAVWSFIACLLYGTFTLLTGAALLIATVLALPLALFGSIAIIGLVLHLISLLLSGIGLV